MHSVVSWHIEERGRLTVLVADGIVPPLTDVEIVPLDGRGEAERRPFIALALNQIVLAMPTDGANEVE